MHPVISYLRHVAVLARKYRAPILMAMSIGILIVVPRMADTYDSSIGAVNIYRITNETCNGTLELPQEEVLKVISSKKFPGTDKYISELFPRKDNRKMPNFPVFVTALSSNHYEEFLLMLDRFNKTIRKEYPYAKLFIVDIGLSTIKKQQIEAVCNCSIRMFPFDRFPKHVSVLKGYAWKPIIIQLMVQEHPFLVYMDTSIRFKSPNIDSTLERAKRQGVLYSATNRSLVPRTFQKTFELLGEEPCIYRDLGIIEATLIIIYARPFEIEYLLKPWVSCALMPTCMVPLGDPTLYLYCQGVEPHQYFKCHRFDQSVWSILIHRLYRKRVADHTVSIAKIQRNIKG